MQQSRPRKPRFARAPEAAHLALTSRDLQILSEVAAHRFVQSHHLVALLSGSAQHVVRRLGKLYHAGLLERPKAQMLLKGIIAPAFAYCLTPAGRRIMTGHNSEALPPVPRLKGTSTALSLAHSLRVTDVLVAIRRSAASRQAAYSSLPEEAASFDAEKTSPAWRLRWKVRHDGQTAWIVPDGAFVLKPADGEAKFFALEVDRGTMPVSRSNPGQSSFMRKVELYKETRGQGVLWNRFGIPAFRVLVVAESPQRLASIRRATAKLFKRGESEMFLFTTSTLLMSGDALDGWMSCGGQNKSLMPTG